MVPSRHNGAYMCETHGGLHVMCGLLVLAQCIPQYAADFMHHAEPNDKLDHCRA